MFIYYNANPYEIITNDCAIRAIALALSENWNKIYKKLNDFCKKQNGTLNDLIYIESYLNDNFELIYKRNKNNQLNVEQFSKKFSNGSYIILIRDYITYCEDGIIHDTFYPCDRIVHKAYKVR